MAPIPVVFTDETSQSISAAKRRQNDLVDFQIPRLRSCQGPLSLQQNLAAELREDIDSFARQVEALELSIGDQRGEKNRAELRRIVDEFQSDLVKLRRDSRAALLISKRAIDSQKGSQREELLASSAVTEKANSNEKVTFSGDALMKASDNVTEALRRTIGLMQSELERSVLSSQMLDASTASLHATSSTHDTLTNFMGTSKQLITALEKSDWIDRVLIISAFVFFLLVVLFIIKQRVVDRGLRMAFWWTRFLPDFSRDAALLDIEKQNAPSPAALTTSLISSVLSVSATTAASSIPTSLISSTEHGDVGKPEPPIPIETSFGTLSSVVPSSTVTKHRLDELHHVADEL
ncbi:hypothetical protein C0995_010160 [Termitomyces sp. Mi166|nr:hypothetical protein C0995_010160 [Termitomyces sp. Mi166\